MINFILNDKDISDKIITYTINYTQQWYPGAYITTYEKLQGKTLKILNKADESMIFMGHLEKIIEDNYTTIYFFIYPSSGLKIDDYNGYWYDTFTTQGGYFNGDQYIKKTITWDVFDDDYMVIKENIIYEHMDVIIKKNPHFNIQYKYHLNRNFSIKKVLDLPASYHNKIMENIENFQNHQVKISDIISEDNSLIIHYIHHIPYEITENLTIEYNNGCEINSPIDIILSHDIVHGQNNDLPSIINGKKINNIISNYHNYHNFDTIIELKFYNYKNFHIGQRVQYKNYFGIIINIIIQNYHQNIITTIKIKSYQQWLPLKQLPNYPVNYQLNDEFIMDQWDSQWNIIVNEDIQWTLPHIGVIYSNVVHKTIALNNHKIYFIH